MRRKLDKYVADLGKNDLKRTKNVNWNGKIDSDIANSKTAFALKFAACSRMIKALAFKANDFFFAPAIEKKVAAAKM
ncbi:hypothetical protein INT46_003766 [Mucor plumbeus]|uniref:Uncharacterized protein n=1 Tax=Mucor plumbeus TaxID=97098 RepID=A0A8H7R9V3_9FUNG|nr:hypothetical protein INT46_003766 [Mucor plumbeus]